MELSKKKNIIVAGDFSVAHNEIDLYAPKTLTRTPCFTKEERDSFSSLLDEVGLIDTFRVLHPKVVIFKLHIILYIILHII